MNFWIIAVFHQSDVADRMRISYVQSKSRELSKYMAETLDEDWKQTRGMEIRR